MRTANGVTTVEVGGLDAEDLQTGVTRSLYPCNGQIIAQRSSDASGLIYLHGDHLGSVSLATNASGRAMNLDTLLHLVSSIPCHSTRQSCYTT